MYTKALSLTLLALILASCATSNEPAPQTPQEKKADVYYGQGTNELVNKNYNQALTYLLKSKELNPKDSKTRNNLGMAYYFREQYALAEKELVDAIDIDSKNTDARVNLGTLYMEKNRFKEAREQFDKALTDLTYPNQFRNYYNLAILSLKEGDRRQAFEHLAQSIKEKEDYCPAHYKLGEMYAEEYRFKQAYDAFKESGKGTCVNDAAPHYQQALTLVNLNRPMEAKRKFKEVMEKFPTSNFSSLAAVQIKKITKEDEQKTQTYQTEVIKDQKSVETPNF